MVLIKSNILQNNMTLDIDIDEVPECVLLLSRVEINFQIVYEHVSCKNTI